MIKEKEKQLFSMWRKERGYEFFLSDGVMDENEWLKQKCKILFVLKEANWVDGDNDLCEFLLSECSPTYWKTWNNVARWTKAILEQGEYPRYVSNSDKSFWLKKVAAMNLKKVGGDAVAENETIWEYAQNDRVFLKAQIELYSPDIIICCGRGKGKNADILHDIIFEASKVSEWQTPLTSSEYDYFIADINGKKVPVVSFYHPQMRGGHERFQQCYSEMLEIGKFLKSKYIISGEK